ncbi:RsmG family class I SAM-dependent methyltransferase [uncultured Desulfovibrio sp.]|uniref:16S rRNA (guanine(527)-N(7))-methyltransferase RsmG n=1 Tax=uncultured Desulfovibrio sp. TaxID=167968 RepID=UPI0003A0487C|nr:RsmG family class I SAM-dependent methyltransferase [uncultured Desulfovibrio sp.]
MREQRTVDRKDLAALAAASGIDVPPTALEPLAVYLEMLCQWNAAMNLAGARAWRDILTRLAADSFHLASFLEELPLPEQPLTWDLGSGAGLPGIPLRMVWTRGGYYMVEVREKRALFLSSALARLQLPSTHVFRGSVEHFFRGQYYPADCIVSRAFMPWPDLLGLTLPRLRPEGVLVILALTPAPERLPAPWRLAGARSYVAAGSGRWFWALSPSSGTDVVAGKSALDGPAGEDGPCLG